jgi:hypothetical protein
MKYYISLKTDTYVPLFNLSLYHMRQNVSARDLQLNVHRLIRTVVMPAKQPGRLILEPSGDATVMELVATFR